MTFDFGGNEKLLGIEEICAKLSISRSTFERLRNPLFEKFQVGSLGLQKPASGLADQAEPSVENLPRFPPPTLNLGRSPRWSVSVLNEWMAQVASRR